MKYIRAFVFFVFAAVVLFFACTKTEYIGRTEASEKFVSRISIDKDGIQNISVIKIRKDGGQNIMMFNDKPVTDHMDIAGWVRGDTMIVAVTNIPHNKAVLTVCRNEYHCQTDTITGVFWVNKYPI